MNRTSMALDQGTVATGGLTVLSCNAVRSKCGNGLENHHSFFLSQNLNSDTL